MMAITDLALRLLVATAIGCVIGLNRDLHGKPTGVRTMGLVGLASAMIVAAAAEVGGPGDATRAIQGIMTGIGFLGAGVIVKEADGDRVHGLTTAATIWLTSALGIACGLGAWALALLAATLAFFVLIVGGPVEKRLRLRWAHPKADPPAPLP
jgi:putative Mg2+ transporter-C (MgtC) family protein